MNPRRLLAPLLAATISYAAALLLTVAVDAGWDPILFYVVGFFGVLGAAASATYAEHSHEKRVAEQVAAAKSDAERERKEHAKTTREFCEANIGEVLRQAATTVAPQPDVQVRANIFLPNTAGNALRVGYQFGMDGSPDLGVEFGPREGCAGHAWTLGDVAGADLSSSPEDQLRITWKLTQPHIALTKCIKAVISAPILHPKNPAKIVGVFNLDSTEPIYAALSDLDTKEYLIRIGALLAAFLWLGGIIPRDP